MKGIQHRRRRYSTGTITDVDTLYVLKEQLDRLQEEKAEAEAEYKHAKRLMWWHSENADEYLFYLGAQMRMIELQEEIKSLEPEIEATAAAYIAGIASLMGRYDDGA